MEEKKSEKKPEKKPEGNLLSKLSPLINLWPAALVVVLIAGLLPTTTPVLQEIPELLSINAEAAKNEESKKEEKETEEQIKGNFEDGVYQGTGTGYGGTITVEVTVEGRSIVSVTILSVPGETASFFARAKGVIDSVIQKQTWEVDVVSGATYSSNGILAAIQNALTGEKVETETAPVQETEPLVEETFEEPDGYQDGTYYGSARGFGGTIQVKVVISDGKITDISIVSAEDETPSYLVQAEAVIDKMIKAQSPAVDVVSGATYSSTGIINAVSQALNKALPAGSEEKPSVPESTKPAKPSNPNNSNNDNSNNNNENNENTAKYKDGVYQGEVLCDDEDTFTYTVRANVTIKDGAIAEIGVEKVNDLSDFPEDNDSYLDNAINGNTRGGVWYEGVVNQIVNSQSTDGVDVVSRATYSSNAITEAVKKCVVQGSCGGNSGRKQQPGIFLCR